MLVKLTGYYLALAMACAAGCLSVDVIPSHHGGDKDASTTLDASDTDGDVDTDAGQTDAEASPIDAGREADADQPIEDSSASKPEGSECARGELQSCFFTPAGVHGVIGGFAAQGEYLYWIELGSTDERDNYQYDGALVRTRIGSWERDEVVSGLDFYDHTRRQILACVTVRAFPGYVLWGQCAYSAIEPRYVRLAETPWQPHTLPGLSYIESCSFDGDNAYCLLDGNVYRRNLALETDWSLLGPT